MADKTQEQVGRELSPGEKLRQKYKVRDSEELALRMVLCRGLEN